jgi:hypothetical protein
MRLSWVGLCVDVGVKRRTTADGLGMGHGARCTSLRVKLTSMGPRLAEDGGDGGRRRPLVSSWRSQAGSGVKRICVVCSIGAEGTTQVMQGWLLGATLDW